MDSFTSDGRTYYRAPTNSDFNGDLNKGSGVMPDIYIYFTRDRKNLSDYGGSKRNDPPVDNKEHKKKIPMTVTILLSLSPGATAHTVAT